MCGISGFVYLNKSKKVDLQVLKRMTNVIEHRGPDGEGYWINDEGSVGFGHRRLAIIDLSDGGKQPMHYLEGRYTITFNGEIYNYIELKKELLKQGYTFRSESDTEVLMALFDKKREKCLDDLEGMFSFSIWDKQKQEMFCARDRFGEKPFHYYLDDKKFIFGSEIKQLWAADIAKNVDERRLKLFSTKGVIDDPEDLSSTFYKAIKKLDAAHYIVLKLNGEFKMVNYWKIDTANPIFKGTIEEAAERFLELFTKSISLRLRSDVPVGSSLSGGLDSSAIVMLIDKLKGKKLIQNTFSARFKNFEKDEGKYIEEVANNCTNVNVHYTWPDQDYFNTVLDKVLYHQDEPFGSASIIAQYAVMELAKKHQVTVLLDGQGADEQLAGYLPYYSIYLDQLYQTDKKKFDSELTAYEHYHNSVQTYKASMATETYRMKLGRVRRKLLNQTDCFKDRLNSRLINDTCVHGLKELLRYADRNSMAHSREVRLPFLSHELVEFIFSLPDEFKLNAGWTKYVLRKAMNPILPKSICWRVDKIGYEPPQNMWMQSEDIQKIIVKTEKELGLKFENKNDLKAQSNHNWRLLMSSRFI